MILSQLKEEQTARGIVTFTLALRINNASNLSEHMLVWSSAVCVNRVSMYERWLQANVDAHYLNNFWFSISAWKPSCGRGLPAAIQSPEFLHILQLLCNCQSMCASVQNIIKSRAHPCCFSAITDWGLFLSVVLHNFLWNGLWALYQSFTLLKSIIDGSILFKILWHNVWKQSEKKCYQISVIAFEQIRQQGQTNFYQFTANHIFCLNSKFCTENVDQTIKTCLLPFLSFFFVTNPLFTHFSTAQLLKAPRFFWKIWKI